ncbi:anti-phage Hailong system nucleotidyltransferase HalB [Methylocystis silviterrae]
MPVAATLLFGSLARADQSEESDTDLLMIGLDQETRHVSVGRLSLFLYPWEQLEKAARDGDLFVCHLVCEAKPLIDPHDYLSKLKQAFEFRSSYAAEIARATDFGWFLVSFGAEFNPQLLTKRALWCVRTILIARSAELRDPVFAPERLAELTSSASAQDLLRHRRAPRDVEAVRRSLRQFLIDEGAGDCALEHADWATFVERFGETSNKVALQTLRQEEESQAGYLG